MIAVKLDEWYWSEATKRADSQPVFALSHRKEKGNEVGCLGEVIVARWLQLEAINIVDERAETTHDYRLSNGETFDVKTKDRTVKPKPKYDCSVSLYNHAHQRPTYYIFVSLQRNKDNKSASIDRFHTAYILGGLDQGQLKKHKKEWKKGQIDPDNRTKIKFDCLNVPIEKLSTCDEVLDIWRST